MAINCEHPQTSPVAPWIVGVATFMQAMDGSVLNNALPSMAVAMGVELLKLRWVVVAYLLTTALFIPLSGWLADRFGVRRVFCLAIIVFTCGSLACAFSWSLTSLVASRVLQGLGGALMVPVGRLAVVKIYGHSAELIKVLSLISLPAILGPVCGPIAGGILVELASWRWIFLMNIPVGVFTFWLTIKYMPDLLGVKVSRFDFWGFVVFSSSIAILSLWLTMAPDSGISVNLGIVAIGLSLMAFYWLSLAKKREALFDIAIFDKPGFLIGILGNICSRMGSGAMPFMVPLFLQLSMGFSPIKAGLFMLAQAVGSITGKKLINIFLPRAGFKTFLQINTISLGLIVCAFSFLSGQVNEPWLVLTLLVFGTVNSMQFTAMNSYILIDLDYQQAGTGNSLLSVVMQVSSNGGVAMGATLLTLFSQFSYKAALKPGPASGPIFGLAFVVIGLVILGASIVMSLISQDADKAKNHEIRPWLEH
ncbi:MAG: MFS transporter [Deltaproteobacteria bacterium]|jgi:EmrB/QacA subfamily drug resistance transporter|nr:MFS transporter [Deltaproteobacteria bacterium]